MSDTIIAVPDDQDKPGMLIIKVQSCDVERLGVEEFRILLDDRMRVLKSSGASSAKPGEGKGNQRDSPIDLTLHRLSRRNGEIFGGRALVAPKRSIQQKRCSVGFWYCETLKTNRLQKMKPVGDTL
jgi:hypothetical protein